MRLELWHFFIILPFLITGAVVFFVARLARRARAGNPDHDSGSGSAS
jgi:hypothetical protein